MLMTFSSINTVKNFFTDCRSKQEPGDQLVPVESKARQHDGDMHVMNIQCDSVELSAVLVRLSV